MKLQILIPQYKETEDVIRPLLDSIEIQQSVDLKNDVGVIIVNDGTDVRLSKEFLDRYSYHIDYYLNEHKGVSATRNACLDKAVADYIMFCDADDMFYNACGLYIIFREINSGGFDSLTSKFIEEIKDRETNQSIYVTHDLDSIFVHGKVHRRQYLIDNNIRWNDSLTLHEDGYFNCLCQRLTSSLKYCTTPFYLWRWRDNSVCRSDPYWVLKTYDHMIRANKSLVEEFLKRDKVQDAQFYVNFMMFDAYFTMQRTEWKELDNKEHCTMVQKYFKDYYLKFKYLFDTVPEEIKNQTITQIKSSNLVKDPINFEDWLRQIEEI
jgi:glycosyltransferase involved in cell wall biosynthesis